MLIIFVNFIILNNSKDAIINPKRFYSKINTIGNKCLFINRPEKILSGSE